MIIRCEFSGVDCPQGLDIGGGWSVLGDYSTPLDLYERDRATIATYAATTKCLKFRLRQLNADVFQIEGAVSIRHSGGGVIRHACFFKGISNQLRDIRVGVEVSAIDSNECVGSGGVCRLVGRDAGPEMGIEDRKAVCFACPSGLFTGDACKGMQCCKKRDPSPERWRVNLESGACPKGHWGADKAAEALRFPMQLGHMTVDGRKIALL